ENMAKAKKERRNLWNFVESLEGDKVVWMIVFLLILISIVAIFSSTSMLAVQQGTSRMEIISDQLKVSLVGLVVIILCYNIRKIAVFRFFSQLGFAISITLLAILASHKTIGPLEPLYINQAWRIIKIGGFQVHVFEVVKVAMVMYLAWAVTALKNDRFLIANLLAKKYPIWGKTIVKELVYIYIPILLTCVGIMVGSLSSTIFIGAIMLVTILIGGIRIKHFLQLILVCVGVLIACVGINSVSEKKPFPHLDSALTRLEGGKMDVAFRTMKDNPVGSEKFRKALDKIKQPVSAKVAIKEGRLTGKGPGKSTQRYVVPIMFEDYMFSFIVEEYGLLGGILVIILYISLLARGSLIVRNCDNLFAKTAVAGLVILITGQAMMHIMINCDLGPLTGQTLPMISHGKSSFLMFCLAFGVILSISRMAKKKIERETAKAAPLINRETTDEMENTLNDLDMLESGIADGAGIGEEGDENNNF
ncbi:MAG: FtsW/RodA/SpoVE family cell cycle protein, partial [Candidatus Cryptobacteroides sp.]